jgi:hypothetical protein
MSKLSFLIVSLCVCAISAFAPIGHVATTKNVAFAPSTAFSPSALQMAEEDMYWEGEYPPSKVLGPIMSKMPSGALGMISLACLAACGYSLFQSNLLQQEPGALSDGSWVKWYYILGSFCGPIAWGTHVAAWIQRKNGK